MEYEGFRSVRILRPKTKLTLGQHYRFLLKEATGDFVCFLSHDDALMPRFIEKMRARLDSNVSLVAAACLECNAELRPTSVRGMALPPQPLDPPKGYLFFKNGNAYTISVSIMSRARLLELPPLPPNADLATDWYWAMMLSLRGRVRFIRTPLGYYRIHGGNAGHSNPHGWRDACAAMINFVISQLPAEYVPEMEERLGRIRTVISCQNEDLQDSVKPTVKPAVRTRLKALTKELIAACYRLSLPKYITRPEQIVKGRD